MLGSFPAARRGPRPGLAGARATGGIRAGDQGCASSDGAGVSFAPAPVRGRLRGRVETPGGVARARGRVRGGESHGRRGKGRRRRRRRRRSARALCDFRGGSRAKPRLLRRATRRATRRGTLPRRSPRAPRGDARVVRRSSRTRDGARTRRRHRRRGFPRVTRRGIRGCGTRRLRGVRRRRPRRRRGTDRQGVARRARGDGAIRDRRRGVGIGVRLPASYPLASAELECVRNAWASPRRACGNGCSG